MVRYFRNLSIAARITIFASAALVISSAAIGVFAYFLDRSEMTSESSKRALAIAKTAAAALDAQKYAEIMETREINDYYNEYKAFLNRTFEECGVVYLYVIDKDYDSAVVYFAEGYP
ncbi:MAG: hypothetical protein LBB56_05070, partial [Chitinispirillales bacterium]|nr:hypothetical protein [Chitinispirillales bacterium]